MTSVHSILVQNFASLTFESVHSISVQDFASLTFEPHNLGNYGNYGLNFFGSPSIIEYQNQIWRFCYYSGNDAVYESTNGLICCFNEHEMPTRSDIKRMQVAKYSSHG